MGPDRVIFFSDWPHIDGMPEPLDHLGELANVDDQTRRRVLRDNVAELDEYATRGVCEAAPPPGP